MLTFPHITDVPSTLAQNRVVLSWELSFPVEPAGGLTELVRLGGSSHRRSQRTSGDNISSAVTGKLDNLNIRSVNLF